MIKPFLKLAILVIISIQTLTAQHSIARQWNDLVLDAIRKDLARPTIHARNLFHTSIAMYDSWAIYNPNADTYFLGKKIDGYKSKFSTIPMPEDIMAARAETMSYAVYRLIQHRFRNAPLAGSINFEIDKQMTDLGYNINVESTDYLCGPAELGNYLAQELIAYGLQDGSNEINDYANRIYQPVNPPLRINDDGNPNLIDFDRWQPLQFRQFVDQGGNPIGGTNAIPDFIGAEWGGVVPFSLKEEDINIYQRDGFDYKVYYDPGPPAYIEDTDESDLCNNFKWGHSMVSVWSSHLDPEDPTVWDISPGAKGNISDYPTDLNDYADFYNYKEGGDNGKGHALNPSTGLPYEPNEVLRADYARVLAEFWADGPDSETPPGHWFTILNEVNEHPQLEKRFMGEGPILSDLEWDVKSYFILGGAMHDSAIAAWSIKGWYDYVRPVSVIRAMGERGQCSDPNLPKFDPYGLPLVEGYIENVEAGDPLLEGFNSLSIGDIKIKAWRGPNEINDQTFVANVGWISPAKWWPYQRPSFVTPPFAGYISGHSTFSRAAAEVLTALTGDPFFPGGIGEFISPKLQFLVFEYGPSEEVVLQWATYRDASDQCSLSRIWGGIHPPVDDIPGRLIGEQIGKEAFAFALPYFSRSIEENPYEETKVFPNPSSCGVFIDSESDGAQTIEIYQPDGRFIQATTVTFSDNKSYLPLEALPFGMYILVMRDANDEIVFKEKVILK